MLLPIFIMIMGFTLFMTILALLKESYAIFVISSLLSFITAGCSMVIHLQDGASTYIFSDDVTRIFFILYGIMNVMLALIYRLHLLAEKQE